MADYNGWTNYGTWCISLWLTKDRLLDIIRQRCDAGAGEALKEYVEDEAPDFAFFDLPVALGIINWRELIQNHKSDD